MREFLVVGSGPGGASVAAELSRRGADVLVVERGKRPPRLGTFRAGQALYDRSRRTRESDEGVLIWRCIAAGGTALASCGNGTPCLQAELADRGVELGAELDEVLRETHVAPIAEELIGPGSRRLREAATSLGYRMDPMPKFIDPERCTRCGQCVFGCREGAKWTPLSYLDDALAHGADIVCETTVESVLVENGRAVGVRTSGPEGKGEIRAGTVILSAGGLATPAILQRSGIENAGGNLFVDLFVNTYAVTDRPGLAHEPTMTLVDLEFHEAEGFLISPFINPHRAVRFIELGAKGALLSNRRLVGIMTKISDEPVGRVRADGSYSKPVTQRDRARLDRGAEISAEILCKMGARPAGVTVSSVQGAHPGGTAALGEVVDADLRTQVEGLHVCDASVLPVSPGMPPIVTIAALGKRLARLLK